MHILGVGLDAVRDWVERMGGLGGGTVGPRGQKGYVRTFEVDVVF